MKRSPIRRKTPLRGTSTLRRLNGASPQWRKVRRWVADRSGGWCEARIDGICTSRGEHAHHILMRSQGGRDDLGNLLWVCGACHGHIHANPAASYERGHLRRRTA